MATLERYLELIAAAAPGLRVTSAALHTADGQFNDIVFINGELVFRFPRTAEAAESYPAQAALLGALQGLLPLPTPAPLYRSPPDAAWDRRLIGYPRIAGEALHREALNAVGADDRRAIARQLAGFLRSLHQLDPAELPERPPLGDRPEEWRRLLEGFRALLFAHMRPDARRQVEEQFARYLADAGAQSFRPALRHGDFGGANILYDPRTCRVSGVIDFESLALGDPAVDIAALSTYGEPFLELCQEAYPEIASMRGRAAFYRSTFALQEAYYGARDGDADAFERGLAGYRAS